MKSCIGAVLTAAITISLPVAARTQDDDELEQVVVSGARVDQSPLATPAPVFVIDREQILNSGATRLVDLLQGQVGIQVRDNIGDGGRGVTVAMRGFGENAANNVLVLVDGRRLNNPTLQAPDLNSITLQNIERIEILPGSAGVLFGDQAVGGVINVISRDTGPRTAELQLGAGSFNTRQAQLRAQSRFANGIGLQVSGETRTSDNYRDNNASDYSSLTLRGDYRWGQNRAFIEYQFIDDALRFPGALPEDLAAANRRQTLYRSDFSDLDTSQASLGIDIALNENWRLLTELGRRDSQGDGYQFAANTTSMTVMTVNPRLVGQLRVGSTEAQLSAGIDLTRSDYLFEIPDFYYQTDFDQDLYAAYAQLSWPLGDAWTLNAGLRRSEVDNRDHSLAEDNNIGETLRSIGLSWQLNEQLRVVLRRDETLRYANVDENGFTLPGIDFLRPQTGASLELGFEWYGSQHTIQAVAYRLDLDDEILYDPSAPGPYAAFGSFGANVNLEQSRREGISVSAQWRPLQDLRLSAVYNWTDATVRDGTFDGRQVPYVAEHTGQLAMQWQLNALLRLHAEGVYHGSRYALGDDANSGGRVKDYWLANINLQAESGSWLASLRIDNLGGTRYETLTTRSFGDLFVYPAPRRTWRVSLKYTL